MKYKWYCVHLAYLYRWTERKFRKEKRRGGKRVEKGGGGGGRENAVLIWTSIHRKINRKKEPGER